MKALKYLGISVLFVILLVVISLNTHCKVSVERDFEASPERIWTLWNDVESIKKWWGPKDYTAPIVKNDLRVDGSYLFSMKSPDGKMHWNIGKYKKIELYQKIVSELSFSDENGNLVPGAKVDLPGKWPDSILVTIEFREYMGRTTIQISEDGIPSFMFLFAKIGWQQQFDKFEKILKSN